VADFRAVSAFGPRLLPRLEEGTHSKNRMHISAWPVQAPWDMSERARLIRQKVPELVAAGVTVVREVSADRTSSGHPPQP
jgi:hypothetical protein